MSGWDGQSVVVTLAVTAAAVYLGRRAWLAVSGGSSHGCQGCRQAGSPAWRATDDPTTVMVPLQAVHQSAEALRKTL